MKLTLNIKYVYNKLKLNAGIIINKYTNDKTLHLIKAFTNNNIIIIISINLFKLN